MREYLVFQLYGPLAAWGEIAVGETRPSGLAPSKSAVLGLIAGALGLRRPDTTTDERLKEEWDARHVALSEGYGMAVKLTRLGLPLTDYHTAQVPSSGTGRNKQFFATRRDELTRLPRHGLNTILSRRDYRQDTYAAVALWARPGAPHPLAELRDRLLAPEFVPYLGRKSCPIALPLAPNLVTADTVEDALTPLSFAAATQLIWGEESIIGKRWIEQMAEDHVMLFWDTDAETAVSPSQQSAFTRRDTPASRRRWQFAVREVRQAHLPQGGPE